MIVTQHRWVRCGPKFLLGHQFAISAINTVCKVLSYSLSAPKPPFQHLRCPQKTCVLQALPVGGAGGRLTGWWRARTYAFCSASFTCQHSRWLQQLPSAAAAVESNKQNHWRRTDTCMWMAGLPRWRSSIESTRRARIAGSNLGRQDPLEKGMATLATHSSILAWEMPRTEEPGGPQSMGSQRVGHDWATKLWN